MTFRKIISWCLFPLTMWYAIGVWFRNLLFNIGLKHQETPPVTTIGVGNIRAGGVGKTPHVEYLLRLLADQCNTAMLSRGYRRSSRGYVVDEGEHSVTQLGDEPAMVAQKFPQVTVAVCEKRLEGIRHLLERPNPPQVVVLDDSFQHRYVKPTINILLTEYAHPYYKDAILPFGNLREPRRARLRANIIVVTKSPQNLNPIERHDIVTHLHPEPYQKVFFSSIYYSDPLPLMGGAPLPLKTLDGVLVLAGISNPQPMMQYVTGQCPASLLKYADHHHYTVSDLKHIRKTFELQVKGDRRIILTTEKDAVRLRLLADKEAMAGLPIYYLPIEVRIHPNKEYDFDETVQKIVHDNNLFQDKMRTTPLMKKEKYESRDLF